ncbi:unnamed protein product, partial [Ectocarpus sp. 8 AP-2014]
SADYPDCEGFIGRIGTGICTTENNNELCGYDGGDCCWCDCDSTEYPCEEEGDPRYNCIDPESTCTKEEEDNKEEGGGQKKEQKEGEEEGEDEEAVISANYPDCDGVLNIGTGMCSPDNNNEQCGYDGGDCCWCDCNSPDCEAKGDPSYDCIDPESKCKGEGSLPSRGLQESPRVDSTGAPTPSPTIAPIADSSTFSPTAVAMPMVPVSPGVSQPTDPSSDGVPLGPVVGGVAGGLVIVAIILAVAIKTGLLKNSRHSNTGPTAVPVEPVYPAALQQYPSQSSGRPTTQYPGAYQYPAPIQ